MDSNRLDTVVWLRGKQEKDARRAYSDAHARERAARAEEQRLRDALAQEARFRSDAALWELSDQARAVGERKLKAAAEVTARAASVATQKQAQHLAAHQKLKAVEKVVEGLLEEARAEEQRKERRDTDELAAVRHYRTQG